MQVDVAIGACICIHASAIWLLGTGGLFVSFCCDQRWRVLARSALSVLQDGVILPNMNLWPPECNRKE